MNRWKWYHSRMYLAGV